MEPYISDYFYKCVDWIKKQGDLVVPSSIIGLVNNGLSHLVGVTSKPHFTIALIHGLGGNLTYEARRQFAKFVSTPERNHPENISNIIKIIYYACSQVFDAIGEFIPEPSRILDCYYNEERKRIDVLALEEGNYDVKEDFPPILTPAMLTSMAVLEPWVNSYQPILVSGPEGCGKRYVSKSDL